MYCKMQTAKLEFRDNNNNYKKIHFIHTKYKIYTHYCMMYKYVVSCTTTILTYTFIFHIMYVNDTDQMNKQ